MDSKTNRDKSWPEREPLRVVDIHQFLSMNLPPRGVMLSPWLPEKSTTMIYGRRGLGKTYLALNIAYAVASGGELLGWKAEKPRKVLYLDGEMLATPLQERLSQIVASSSTEPSAGMLHIITPDLQKGFMPDLATIGGQAAVNSVVPGGTELVIVDSLSSLARGEASENEAESWLPLAQWALSQRVAGRSVLFLHHANKRGEQRGTSKREDILDTVLALRPPSEYKPNAPARFEIHIEKSRALCTDFQPVEAELSDREGGGTEWKWKPLELTTADHIRELAQAGMPRREIAEELHISRATVYRTLASGGAENV